jgi:phage FluMu gp28-like protein
MSFAAFVSVMTTLTQTRGRAIIISTPKGRAWFYDVYEKGRKTNDDGTPRFSKDLPDPHAEWFSISLPTASNPYVSPEAIEEARKNLPEDVFRQEYEALFLLESAGVFKNIRGCIRGMLEKPQPGRRYVMGVDLARLRDYSVLIIMDRARKHVVYFERFNKIRWEVQYFRIIQAAKLYNNACVSIDSTGIGDPIVSALEGAGLSLEPYKIGGSTAKQQLIEKLRINIEQERISYPALFDLISELESYEYKMGDGNVVKYSAPSGKHDDCVIALALANWVVDQEPWVYRGYNVRGI